MKYAAILLAAIFFSAAPHSTSHGPITMNKVTPIIVDDEIEPCLSFWTDQLGFELTGTVPHEDQIGFAMMQKGGVELMYQNRASIDADIGASVENSGLGGELSNGTMTAVHRGRRPGHGNRLARGTGGHGTAQTNVLRNG